MQLTEEQTQRYSRNIILPQIGGVGQTELLKSNVLIIGAGGLGSPAALYLAAAGVGHLGIIDSDHVELSNLQRQILHTTKDLDQPKTESAERTLNELNPDVEITPHNQRLTADNAKNVINDYDFIIDGTDNLASKFLIADACHFSNKPYSHAGVLGWEGQTITVIPGQTTCYRCIFAYPPPEDAVPSCAQAGVLGVVPGVFGTIQAAEAVKYLLPQGRLLTDRLLTYNALNMSFRTVPVQKNTECPLCGEEPEIKELHLPRTA